MSASRIASVGAVYHDWVRANPNAAKDFREVIEEMLADAGVTYDRVVARVKQWRSYRAKAQKRNENGQFVYADPWKDIKDLIGVRVTTFYSADIPVVAEVLGNAFVVHKSVDKAAETRISGGFGYGSLHMILEVTDAIEELHPYKGQIFEVQVRTVLQHAWAEFEHDIRYKGANALDPRVDRAFTLAAGLIELADQQFDQIAAIQGEAPAAGDNLELSAEMLPGVLAMLVGDRFPRSRSEYYAWLEEILGANGITTVAELKALLNDDDIKAVERAIKYDFTPGQVRIIDDLLLRRFGEKHIERTGSTGNRAAQRPSRLRRRLQRMQSKGISAS